MSRSLLQIVAIASTALLSACDLASMVTVERPLPVAEDPNTAKNVKIESSIDGTGIPVELLTIRAGDSRTLYAIDRSDGTNSATPALVNAWSITPGLGTLDINANGYSAGFTAATSGTGVISVTVSGNTYYYNVTILPAPNPIVTSNNVLAFATYSTTFLNVDVDWARHYAYVGTAEASNCVHVIDFSSVSAVSIVKSIGAADSIVTCRGTKLFDSNSKLFLSSYGNHKVGVWDVTNAAPSNWAPLASLSVGESGRNPAQIINVGGPVWDIWTASRYRGQKLRFHSVTSALTSQGSACPSNSCPGSDSINAVALLGDFLLMQSYTGVSAPINWWRASTLGHSASQSAANGSVSMTSWGWTTVSNAARTKSFVGGAIGSNAAFTFLGLVANTPTVTKKFTRPGTSVIRWADFTVEGTKEYLYSLSADGRLDKWDATDIINPRLVASHTFTTGTPEFYGIDVNDYTGQAVIVTSRGDFILFDTSKMNVSELPYPIVP
ncbi:MAG: hypothetical protein IPJ84_15910 [Bdellovibrionales bacterium]|nr:hypothetical protein [Bdellovibrionales bacterium]